MELAQLLISLFLLVSTLQQTNGSCQNQTDGWTHCEKWADIDRIDARHIKSLKVSIDDETLDPTVLKTSAELQHLDLSHGKLKRIESKDLYHLTNLKSLNLAHNEIERFDSNAVEASNHLRSLDLSYNNLKHIPTSLKRLKKLRHLELQGNPLECTCGSLKMRDIIFKRGIKMSKQMICAGPGNLKGVQLTKPQSRIVCAFEEQDKEMLNDQGIEGSAEGSGDENDVKKFPEESVEIETPFPDNEELSTSSSGLVIIPTSITNTTEEDFTFDPEEKQSSTTSAIKDGLFYPVEVGSGEEEDSGEGSGTGGIYPDNDTDRHPTSSTPASGLNFWELIFGKDETKKPRNDPNPDEEGFITATSEKSLQVSTGSSSTSSTSEVVLETSSIVPTSTAVSEIIKTSKTNDADTKIESVHLPTAGESKKGMGSYIVLAILLVILLALIGFAAYKGDFCRKKTKRPSADVENGTELKDMQKSLLESNNSAQAKITTATNGNAEIVPLVNGVTEQEQTPALKSSNGRNLIDNIPTDKLPPTNSYSLESMNKESLHPSKSRTNNLDGKCPSLNVDDAHAPPLSPGAQRVKIILQDNPDSVPKTPILITRTSTN